jgi:hypothetical protein
MTTSKIALVTLALLLSTGTGTRPTIAASDDRWFVNYVNAHGGCAFLFARENDLFRSKPATDWSDNNIVEAVNVYKGCEINNCTVSGNYRKTVGLGTDPWCKAILSSTEYPRAFQDFEDRLRNVITPARNLENRRKAQKAAQVEVANADVQRNRDQATKDAQQRQEQLLEQARRDREAAEDARQQQQARVEFEKAQAASRLAQAEDDAHRKQEQLREQAQRDREAAEATARLAEREEPKIAEATREAEAARQARHAAEQRLAESTSRLEAQETARKQQADQEAAVARQTAAQEAVAQANLPVNILGTAYAAYVDVKRCQEAREGYQLGYISDPEMNQAKDAVLTIEQTMKSKLDQNTTTDDVWSRVATTEGRSFHPSGDYQAGTRTLCRSRLALLLGILREQAPETGVIKKDF